MSTRYSIIGPDYRFDNQNSACYAETFGLGSLEKFSNFYCGAGRTLELYITYQIGGFKVKNIAIKFFEIIKKLGLDADFTYEYVDNLPRNLGAGWLIRFNKLLKENAKDVKIAVYIIRFMWEIAPKNFADFLIKIFNKYGKTKSPWVLLKYAYFVVPLVFNENCTGHYLPYYFKFRQFDDDLQEKLKEDWNLVYQNLFLKKNEKLNSNYYYSNNFFGKPKPKHFPQNAEEAFTKLSHFIKNPQKELDNQENA